MSEDVLLKYSRDLGRIVSMGNIEDAFEEQVMWSGGGDGRSSRAWEDPGVTSTGSPGFAMVLIVEDSPRAQVFARRLVVMAVSPRPVNVVIASSAEDAIALLRSFYFDLVVSDYDLGNSDGGQVLSYVQESIPHMLERFVFFSGSEEPARLLPGRVIDKCVAPDRFVSDLRAMIPRDLRG